MIDELNATYGLDERLVFCEHSSGLVVGHIESSLCSGRFFLHGAHLASFRPHREAVDVIFMSSKSVYEPDKAIRGGVPICFPWFGPHPSDPQAPAHGLARTATWQMLSSRAEGDAILVELGHDFEAFRLRYVMRFASDLRLSLSITNRSASPQCAELALHTYFDLQDATTAQVSGLEQLGYFDKVTSSHQPATGQPITFDRETDSVYVGKVNELRISDRARGRTVLVRPENSASTVVWNPWIAKSQRMADFGDHEYRHMCCVETARVADDKLELAAGAEATVAVTLSTESD